MVDSTDAVVGTVHQFGQQGADLGVSGNVGPGVASSAVGRFVLTGVVGAVVVAIVPEHPESTMHTPRRNPSARSSTGYSRSCWRCAASSYSSFH